MNLLYSIFLGIVNMAVTASFVILIVLLLRLCIRRAPKIFSYLLWSVVGFRLICPVSFTSILSILNIRLYHSSNNSGMKGTITYFPNITQNTNATDITTEVLPAANSSGNIRTAVDQVQKTIITPGNILALLWLLGIVALLTYGVLSFMKMKHRVSNAVLLRENIYECGEIPSPFVLGMLKPRIYIPFRLTDQEQSFILKHEQHHIKRFDHILKPIAFLLLIIYWFHPLVWAAYFCMCRDMEMSCDEKVINETGVAIKNEYSLSLLSFAVNRRFPASPLAFGETDTKGRIKNILSFKKPKLWVSILIGLICLLVILACAANPKAKEDNITPASSEREVSDLAGQLFENKNPYIGDASADGALLRTLGISDEMGNFTIELETSKEPYVLRIVFEDEVTERESFDLMPDYATILLALIDNADEIQWSYPDTRDGQPTQVIVYWSEDNLKAYDIGDIKSYGKSEEKVQELLDFLTANAGDVVLDTNEKAEDSVGENILTMDTLMQISDLKKLTLDYFKSYDNAVDEKMQSEEALNAYIIFSLTYEGKSYELQVSYMKADNSIDMIRLVKKSDSDVILLYSADPKYKVDTDIDSFLKKDIRMSDYISYQLPEGYADSNYIAYLGGYGGNLFLENGEMPEKNENAPINWYAPGGVLMLPASALSDPQAGFVSFEDGRLVSGSMHDNHTMPVADPVILDNLAEQAVLMELSHDLYTAAQTEEAKAAGKPIPAEDQTSTMYEIYFAREDGKVAYCIFLNEKYFTKDAAVALAESVRFTELAFK